jgi:Tfp pilus assembly protein PilN
MFDLLGRQRIAQLQSELDKARAAQEEQRRIMEEQLQAIAAYKTVLNHVINERNGWEHAAREALRAVQEWKGLSEQLQTHFAMLEPRGSLN